jgi:hypothetical protein
MENAFQKDSFRRCQITIARASSKRARFHELRRCSILLMYEKFKRHEGGSRRSGIADHIHLDADVQFCSLSLFQIAGVLIRSAPTTTL